VLGSFGNSLNNGGIDAFQSRLPQVAPKQSKKQEQQLKQSIEREWSELPYAMMRFSAARRAWDSNRVYWRDSNVHLGEIDLHLHKTRPRHDAPGYMATYSHEEIHRDFLIHPSLEDGQLSWSAPGISEVQLTTNQLAEKLLGKLVTFYATGLQ